MRTSCLDVKSETANDELDKQNASQGWKEVTNSANWRIRWWRIWRTEMFTKDRNSAGTDKKVTN